MAILTRSFCLLLVAVVTVSHVEANIFSDVLSWVGLGGSEKQEEAVAEDIESVEPVADDVEPELPDEEISENDGEEIDPADNEESEDEANAGRAEEL